ncbi:MAG: tetratricopeptide repeat protein [Limisphaerales bacterium]
MKNWIGPVGILVLCLAALVLVAAVIGMRPSRPNPAPSSRPLDVEAVRAGADLGDARAQRQLGEFYAHREGVAPNYAEGAKWYRRAAEQGDADGQAALGELCQAGQGVPKNLAEAGSWFHLAARQGNARAQYSLAFMYETGRGFPQDQAEAARWYRLAAEQGMPLAQYDLGQRYDLGVGLPVDRVEALKWLSLAAAQGQTDALDRRDKVRSKMTRKEIVEAKKRIARFSPSHPPAPSKSD